MRFALAIDCTLVVLVRDEGVRQNLKVNYRILLPLDGASEPCAVIHHPPVRI